MENLPLGWLLFLAFVVLATLGAWRTWLRFKRTIDSVERTLSPPRELVVEVRDALRAMQIAASDEAVFEAGDLSDEIPSDAELAPRDKTATSRTVAAAVRLDYGVDWSRAGYLHRVSVRSLEGDSDLSGPVLRVAVLLLTQQIEDAGIETDGFEPDNAEKASSIGEIRLPTPRRPLTFAFRLTPAQHDSLMRTEPPWGPGLGAL